MANVSHRSKFPQADRDPYYPFPHYLIPRAVVAQALTTFAKIAGVRRAECVGA